MPKSFSTGVWVCVCVCMRMPGVETSVTTNFCHVFSADCGWIAVRVAFRGK